MTITRHVGPVAKKDNHPCSSVLESGSPMLMSYERVILRISASLLDFHYFGRYQSVLGLPALRCIRSVYPFTVVYHSIRLSSHVPLFLPLMNIAS